MREIFKVGDYTVIFNRNSEKLEIKNSIYGVCEWVDKKYFMVLDKEDFNNMTFEPVFIFVNYPEIKIENMIALRFIMNLSIPDPLTKFNPSVERDPKETYISCILNENQIKKYGRFFEELYNCGKINIFYLYKRYQFMIHEINIRFYNEELIQSHQNAATELFNCFMDTLGDSAKLELEVIKTM